MSAITPQGQKLLKQVTSYRYFVSYFWANAKASGFGMLDMTMSLPPRGAEDARLMCAEIKRIGKIKGDIVIINWILL